MQKIVVALCLFTASLFAQIDIGGMLDMQVSKGEHNSNYFVNGVRNTNTSFYINQLQLYLSKDLDTNISVNVIIDATLYSSLNFADFYIYEASLLVHDVFRSGINFEIGKVMTPFGHTSQLLFANTNPLIGLPLSHQYYSRISGLRGYFPVSPDKRNDDDRGLPMIYQRPYFNGVKFSGMLASRLFDYEVGVFNQSLSNLWGEIDLNKQVSFAGRLGVNPAIWLNAGVSYHHGAYMDSDTSVNGILNINSYKQNSIGFDVNVNIYYYELQAEYINNSWNAPYIKPDQSNILTKDNIDLNEQSIYVTFKVDMPFLPGAYIAAKYDKLIFNTITDPDKPEQSKRWNPNITRTEFGGGYKFTKDITAKLVYQFNHSEVVPAKKLNAVLGQVYILF